MSIKETLWIAGFRRSQRGSRSRSPSQSWSRSRSRSRCVRDCKGNSPFWRCEKGAIDVLLCRSVIRLWHKLLSPRKGCRISSRLRQLANMNPWHLEALKSPKFRELPTGKVPMPISYQSTSYWWTLCCFCTWLLAIRERECLGRVSQRQRSHGRDRGRSFSRSSSRSRSTSRSWRAYGRSRPRPRVHADRHRFDRHDRWVHDRYLSLEEGNSYQRWPEREFMEGHGILLLKVFWVLTGCENQNYPRRILVSQLFAGAMTVTELVERDMVGHLVTKLWVWLFNP